MPVYFDHNATTPLHPNVFEAMQPYMGAIAGNPSSLHRFGRLQRDAVEQARAQVARLVDARPEQVIFTSGGTEANNLLIKGLCANTDVKHIAVSAIEHMSMLEPVTEVSAQVASSKIEVDENGVISEAAVSASMNEDTALVSVMAANNETGVIQDIQRLAKLVNEKGAWFHTDASQLAGKCSISCAELGVQAMTLSAHKIYGPMGMGALIVDKRVPLQAMMHGGSQENALRAGTENVPAIVGFGQAAELALQSLEPRNVKAMQLREQLEQGLDSIEAAVIFSRNSERLPNTVQFGIAGFDGETLLMQLDRRGYAVSSGSACTSGKAEPSHVLKAMKVPVELARSSVRVSFGEANSAADVDGFIVALKEITEMKNSAVMMAATV